MTNSTIFSGWTSRLLLGLMSLALLSLIHPAESGAQEVRGSGLDECAGGTLFLIAHPDTVTNTQDGRFPDRDPESFVLLIYSPVSQQISIGRTGGAGKSVQLNANEVYEFDTKEVGVPMVTIWNQVERSKVIEVKAQTPVVIYGYISSRFGCHGFTALPVETWGTEYFAAAWPGEVIRNVYPAGETNYDASEKKEGPAEIMIIAAYDNTQVSISPTGGLYQCNGCTQVTLNKGEAYIVQSFVDLRDEAEDQEDIAGTLIQANKRIGVISGNTRTQIDPFSFPMLAGNSPKDQTAEWLTPIEQHGTEFVFMPTEDLLRQRPNAEVTREAEYVRIFPTDLEETEIVWLNTLGQREPVGTGMADPTEFRQLRIGFLENAVPFFTSDPAQGYQAPKSVAQFNGTTGGGNFIGASYNAWGTYMVEMVPREQWTSFAPYRAPSIPSDFTHYMNIVTDTNSKQKIYRKQGPSPRTLIVGWTPIAGTDLIWTSLSVDAGTTYIIEGDSGATFGGFAYGLQKGYELYRPGGTKDGDDDDKSASAAGGGDGGGLPSILHPSEYEESVGQMYGMPLAPSRCVLLPPDEYEVITNPDCDKLDVTIRAKNNNAAGIKFIRLVNDSTRNARLEFVDPDDPIALRERVVTEARVRFVAINPLQDAEGVLEFKDRTKEGQVIRVRWKYQAERVDLDPADILDFGSLTINQPAGEKSVTITNPLTRNVVVKRLRLAFGNREFRITRSEPAFTPPDSVILKPGESMKVWIDITPKDENRVYEDSLVVQLGCVTVRLPLRAATVQPCLFVGDLNFGTLGVDQPKTLPLQICNTGDGTVRFVDPFLTWVQTEFSVPATEVANLANVVLGPGDCHTINVTFVAGVTGNYRTRPAARFWATTRQCRDTSVWTAIVTEPGPQIGNKDWENRWLSVESGCTKNDTLEYTDLVQITNTGDSEFRIDDIQVVDDPDNVFRAVPVNAQNQPIDVIGRLVRPGDVIDVRVYFKPMAVKDYDGNVSWVRLYYTIPNTGVSDSVDGYLRGEGIESYIAITGDDFGRVQFTTPGANTVTRTLTITASGNRPTTITRVFVDDPNFTNVTLTTPNTATPFTLAPNETQEVEVTFDPTGVDPVSKVGTINVEGDFAYANCSESDSTGDLTGAIYTLGATIDNHDFGSILTCFEGSGTLTVQNTGLDPVKVTDIQGPTPNDQYFTIDPNFILNVQANPVTLAPIGSPGDQLTIPVDFAPDAAGTYNADVTVTIMDTSETTTIQELVGTVTGVGRVITITLSVDDIPPTFPGLPINDVPVRLTGENVPNDPAAAQISNFQFTVQYDAGMMRLTGDVELGDLFPESEGWELEILDRAAGYLNVRISNPDRTKVISGEGNVLLLDFITFIGDDTESTIEPEGMILTVYGMNSENDCVIIEYDPGVTGLDSVCGLDFRLIEASGIKYGLSNASPNVTSTRTEISFSIGIEGETTIEVFDQKGNRVGLLVDQTLQPGGYAVSWDVRSVPSGKYFYRITSGPWSETKEVMVQK